MGESGIRKYGSIRWELRNLLTQREARREVRNKSMEAQLNNFSFFPHKVLPLPSEVKISQHPSAACVEGQRGGVMVMKGSVQN